MIKWSFALTWQQHKCTQPASKYFIFKNIVWMGSSSTLSETTHKHVRTPLPPGSVTVPLEYDLVLAQILGHSCSWKFHRSRRGDTKQFHLLLSLQLHSLSFILKVRTAALPQPLSSPSWNTNVYLYALNEFLWGWKDKWQKAKHACHWIWIWRTCLPLRDALIWMAFVKHKYLYLALLVFPGSALRNKVYIWWRY